MVDLHGLDDGRGRGTSGGFAYPPTVSEPPRAYVTSEAGVAFAAGTTLAHSPRARVAHRARFFARERHPSARTLRVLVRIAVAATARRSPLPSSSSRARRRKRRRRARAMRARPTRDAALLARRARATARASSTRERRRARLAIRRVVARRTRCAGGGAEGDAGAQRLRDAALDSHDGRHAAAPAAVVRARAGGSTTSPT